MRATWINLVDRRARRATRTGYRVHRLAAALACLWMAGTTITLAQGPIPGPSSSQVRTYLDAIDNAQTLGGPYAIELVDLYYGFGQALLEEGDLEAALDAFHRTAMVARVNFGPNSLDQANYLYSIAKVESLLGNYQESIAVLGNLYSLHANHYGEDDPAMLPVVEQITAWYEEQQPLNAPLTRSSDYLNRAFLSNRTAHLTEVSNGLGSELTAMRYREEGQLHFQAIYYMIRSGEIPDPELVLETDGEGSQWFFERSLSYHFRTGEEVFGRVIASWRQNPEGTDLEIAEAIAQLGDWYLALQHFRSAEKEYERAYEFLSNSAEYSSLADDYLGEPAPLRFMNTTERYVRDLDVPLAEGGLEIVMTVSRSGRLHDVEIRNPPPGESEADIRDFAQRLESTRFRPAVINGKVERIERFVWRPPAMGKPVASAGE